MPHQRGRRRRRVGPNPTGVFFQSLGNTLAQFFAQQRQQAGADQRQQTGFDEAERVRQERFAREEAAAVAKAEADRRVAGIANEDALLAQGRGAGEAARIGDLGFRASQVAPLQGAPESLQAVAGGFSQPVDPTDIFGSVMEQISGSQATERVPTDTEVRGQFAGAGQQFAEGGTVLLDQPGQDSPLAVAFPGGAETLDLQRALQAGQERRQILPTTRAAITPLEGDDLPDNAISFIVNSANELRSGAVTQAAGEAAQRSAVALDLVGQLNSGQLEGGIAQVDSALARAAVRYLEQDKLSDADYVQITGLDARTIQQSVRLAVERFVNNESTVFTDEERAALTAIVQSGDALSRRMLDNTAKFARQQATAIFGLPPDHPALNALVAPPLPTIFAPQLPLAPEGESELDRKLRERKAGRQ